MLRLSRLFMVASRVGGLVGLLACLACSTSEPIVPPKATSGTAVAAQANQASGSLALANVAPTAVSKATPAEDHAPAMGNVAAPNALPQPDLERDTGVHAVHVENSQGLTTYLEPQATGLAQSPINILTGRSEHGRHAVQLHYKTTQQHLTNLGHTVKVAFDPGSSLEFDGKTYDLAQFHFHTPSEHLVDGVTYPMEMHVVHTLRGNPNKYLVVGVLFKQGPNSALLDTLLTAVPSEVGKTVDVDSIRVDAGQLFGADEHYYHYEGSLTTPPYSEAVTWLVLKTVHSASPGQIERLNEIEGNNARHIQRIRDRAVDIN